MSAVILTLPRLGDDERDRTRCTRCGGLRRLTYGQLDRMEQSRVVFGSVFPCPSCGYDAEIIPFGRLQ